MKRVLSAILLVAAGISLHAAPSFPLSIRDKAPHHLITAHNAHEHASAEFFGGEAWLDLNAAYTYREVHPHILAEWNRPFADGRPRPVFLIESGYERENNDKRGGDG